MAICGIVLGGVVAVIPCLIFYTDTHRETCMADWPTPTWGQTYYTGLLIVIYVLPLSLIFALYLHIARILSNNSKHCAEKGLDSRAQLKRTSSTRRAIVKISCIVVAFSLCVLPRYAVRIFFEFNRGSLIGPFYHLQYLAYLPYPLHVAINPIIYSLVDPVWRKEAGIVLREFYWKLWNRSGRPVGHGEHEGGDGSGAGGISFQRLQQQSMEDILSLGGDNNKSASSSA